jgi:hypothetical protein
MRKTILFGVMVFQFVLLYSQNFHDLSLPPWIKMGMSEAEIRESLTNGRLIDRGNGCLVFTRDVPYPLAAYQFVLHESKGLVQFWIVFDNAIDLVDNQLFHNYGKYKSLEDNSIFWDADSPLPENVSMIFISSDRKQVVYFFTNYWDGQ